MHHPLLHRIAALLTLLSVASSWADSAPPSEPRVTPVAPSPAVIEIVAITEGKPATYSGSIWLEADGDVEGLSVVPSVLTGSNERIEPAHIRVNSGVPFALLAHAPKLLTVSIDTDWSAGLFTGTLTLLAPKLPASHLTPISLKLDLAPKPSLLTLPAQFNFRLSHCTAGLTCGSTPGAHGLPELRWQLTNEAQSRPVHWTPSSISLRGDKQTKFIQLDIGTWAQGEFAPATPGKSHELTPGSPLEAGFAADLAALPADHYQGQYRIELSGADSLTRAVSLDVRDGCVWPCVVLFGGILLGRFIQWSNSERNKVQLALLDTYHSVLRTVGQLSTAPDRAALTRRLETVLVDIRLLSRSQAEIAQDLAVLNALAGVSLKLDFLDPSIQSEPDTGLKTQLQNDANMARAAIARGDLPIAQAQVQSILAGLGGSASRPQRAAALIASSTPSAAAVAPTPAPSMPNIVLSRLAGTQPFVGSVMHSYGRPLLFLLLLAGLVGVGLYNLYFRNATFGSDGFFDYLSLILWGTSADVAQKSLQQLVLNKTP